MLPLGAGVESLLPGDYVLVWYAYDHVWHERAVLWKIGKDWEVVTPDDDEYIEALAPGGKGPVKLLVLSANGIVPASVTEPVYRFSSYPLEAEHNARLRTSFQSAKAQDGNHAQLFSQVKGYDGVEVASDLIVGWTGIPLRLTGKTGLMAPPSGAAPPLPRLPAVPSRSSSLRRRLWRLRLGSLGMMWLPEWIGCLMGTCG